MKTERIYIDPLKPEKDRIDRAASWLERGEVVAFPTETVYGLGAIASDEKAVARIYEAKGRPPVNPLIVHVDSIKTARSLVACWPPEAEKLARQFWPGPLTLVLPAGPSVSEIVRAGKETVGLRMPDHPVALALIARTAALAAPSANLSGRPSPRTADDVLYDLEGRIPAVLDAGPTPGGIESTVLDLSGPQPTILRPGGIRQEDLEQALGRSVTTAAGAAPSSRLPHYRTGVRVFVTTIAQMPEIKTGIKEEETLLVAGDTGKLPVDLNLFRGVIRWTEEAELYSVLRQAEKSGAVNVVFIRDSGIPWSDAIAHRLAQAAVTSV